MSVIYADIKSIERVAISLDGKTCCFPLVHLSNKYADLGDTDFYVVHLSNVNVQVSLLDEWIVSSGTFVSPLTIPAYFRDSSVYNYYFEENSGAVVHRFRNATTNVYTIAEYPRSGRLYTGLIAYVTEDEYYYFNFSFFLNPTNTVIEPTSNTFGSITMTSYTDTLISPATQHWNCEMFLYLAGIISDASEIDNILDDGGTQSDSTGTTGGDGTFDYTGDTITEDSLPSVSALDTGFITLYNPSVSQLNSLASYMWSTNFTGAILNTFASPMDAILFLNLMPVAPSTRSSQTVTVGNVATTVSMPPLTSQWVEVSCGSVTLDGKWGAYLDYEPYAKAEIYLPYLGHQNINVNDITGQKNASVTVELKYKFDMLSGAVVVLLIRNNSVLYQWQGNCGIQLPISGRDYGTIVGGLLGIVGQKMSSIGQSFSGGAGSGLTSQQSPTSVGGYTQNSGGGWMSNIGIMDKIGGAFMNALGSGALSSMGASVLGSQTIEHGGAIGGAGGLMAQQTPYINFTCARQVKPNDYGVYTGYPCYKTMTLSSLTGYCECANVILKGIDAKEPERAEIIKALQSGVYFSGNYNSRPTQSGSTMTITTYINKSPDYYIGKSLTKVESYTGKLRAGCDEHNPVILIEQDGRTNLVNMNYCSISWFERWYYVTDVVSVREGLWEIHCSVDAPETFSEGIRKCKAFVTRSQSAGNLYMRDDRMPVQTNPYILQYEFSGSVSRNESFILGVAGA